jgi:hypothetical protein
MPCYVGLKLPSCRARGGSGRGDGRARRLGPRGASTRARRFNRGAELGPVAALGSAHAAARLLDPRAPSHCPEPRPPRNPGRGTQAAEPRPPRASAPHPTEPSADGGGHTFGTQGWLSFRVVPNGSVDGARQMASC